MIRTRENEKDKERERETEREERDIIALGMVLIFEISLQDALILFI